MYKIAMLIEKANFDKYSPAVPDSWELIHLGNSADGVAKLALTGADAVLTDPMLSVPGEVLSKMPQLKIVHSFGVGFDGIDIEAAKSAGIFVCNNAGVNAEAVAE